MDFIVRSGDTAKDDMLDAGEIAREIRKGRDGSSGDFVYGVILVLDIVLVPRPPRFLAGIHMLRPARDVRHEMELVLDIDARDTSILSRM